MEILARRILLICTLSAFLVCQSGGQNSEYKLNNYTPVSPTAFQFLKYMEIPVSEYTGIPNITLPLYQIEVDGLKVPVTLTYHAGGIRVSQEASWVGLGWDLQMGGIYQEVNDVDDYGIGTIRLRPDYNFSPVSQQFPWRYTYVCAQTTGPGWYTPYPIQPVQPNHSYMVATAYYVPINGDFNNNVLGQDLFTGTFYDSEPDIFRANFLGHNLIFKLDFATSQIVVLNKKGYKVSRTGDTYKIIAPTGEEFYFETSNTVQSYSATDGGLTGGGTTSLMTSARTWVLTKVITTAKREIIFNYSVSSAFDNYPSYSEKWDKTTAGTGTTNMACAPSTNFFGYAGLTGGGISKTFSYSNEARIHLSSISFPNGQVTFTLSDRDDMLGGKKLDAIQIENAEQLIKSFQLNYDYFRSDNVGGNVSQPINPATYGNTPNRRLKLTSVYENSGAVYSFIYDPTPLPPKNSLAQDFWGFYNGQLSNTSLIPNPARLNIAGLSDNGNNNSANINFIKAGLLTAIGYPTGGRTEFEYELNQFDNYWVPDFSSTSNTISAGNGLRVKKISFYASDPALSKRTVYTYEGGKAIAPIRMYRQYSVNSIYIPSSTTLVNTPLTIDELNAKGFISTNSLGSVNGVGYSKVFRQEVDGTGVPLGKTETNFFNTPDIVSNTAGGLQLSSALPAIRRRDVPENGRVQSVRYFDAADNLLKTTVNTFTNVVSDIDYAARIFGYTSLFYGVSGSGSSAWTFVPQTLIGYYPMYGIESLQTSSVETEYDENGNNLIVEITHQYDSYNQVSETVTTGSASVEQALFARAYDNMMSPGHYDLFVNNRLTEVTQVQKYKRNLDFNNPRLFSNFRKEYGVYGNKVIENKVVIDGPPGTNPNPAVVTFDMFDTYGNPNQVTRSGEISSLLWGYSGEYVVAEVKNATYADIAYTSFESGDKGNWIFSGTPTSGAYPPTGKMAYLLSGGNIVKNGLNSADTYIVSYWKSTGSVAVNGVSSSPVHSIGNWTYHQQQVVNPAGGQIIVSGTGEIDELRLYPAKAEMTTYAYIPLLGMSALCDKSSRITYYEYNSYGRLDIIRDQDRNILKKFCYNFSGQPEECVDNTDPLWQRTGHTRCQPCSANPAYSNNILEHQERDNNPSSPTYNTYRWISNGSSSLCVPEPDWQNTATAIRCKKNIGNQNTGEQEQEQKDLNPCSATYNLTRWVVIGVNTTACPLPPPCSPSNCVGTDKKCINNICETGIKVYTGWVKLGPHLYECTYHYEWSDGSWSPNYTEHAISPCMTEM